MNSPSRVRLYLGDITSLDVDAMVTAANEELIGGGGVDGAIHSAAGPELVAASRRLAPCPPGEARITPGFNSTAQHIIHAVGPIFKDGNANESKILSDAYRSSLQLAADNQIRHVAFPCISTGVYGYPHAEACHVAINSVVNWLKDNSYPELITFCCFDHADHQLYADRLTELGLIDTST